MSAHDNDIRESLIELRSDFRSHARAVATTLEQLTRALEKLATLEIQNAARDARENARDDKIKALQVQVNTDIKTLEDKVSAHETKLAWYAGAIAAAGVAWQLLSKKLGL